MSTKTLRKRIALVAVSAMGFGLISAAPSSAAESASSVVTDVILSASAGSILPTGTKTVTAKVKHGTVTTTNEITLKAFVLSKPTGAATSIVAAETITDQTAGTTLTGLAAVAGGSTSMASIQFDYIVDTGTPPVGARTSADASLAAAAQGSAGADGITFGTFALTADLVGAYTMRVFHDASADGIFNSGEQFSDIVVNVAAGGAIGDELPNSADLTPSITGATFDGHKVSSVGIETVQVSGRTGVQVGFAPQYRVTRNGAAGAIAESTGANLGTKFATIAYSVTNPAGTAVTVVSTQGGTTASASQAIAGVGTIELGTDATAAENIVAKTQAISSTTGWPQKGSIVYFSAATAGTYTITAFHDANRDSLISVGEATTSSTVVIAADALPSITMTTFGQSVPADAANGGIGHLVRISLRNGTLPASLGLSEVLTISGPTGTVIDTKSVRDAATLKLGMLDNTAVAGGRNAAGVATADSVATLLTQANFDAAGNAYINVGNGTAGTHTLLASISGGTAAGATGSGTITVTDVAVLPVTRTTANTDKATSFSNLTGVAFAAGSVARAVSDTNVTPTLNIAPNKAITVSVGYLVGDANATANSKTYEALFTDTYGLVTGVIGATYDMKTSLGSSATTATTRVSFSVGMPSIASTVTGSVASIAVLQDDAGAAVTTTFGIAVALPVATRVVVDPASTTLNTYSLRAAIGSTNAFTATVVDQYGIAMAGLPMSAQVTAGRNAQLLVTPMITDASGKVSFSVTDTSVSTLLTSDTLVFTTLTNAIAGTVTINYAATLPVATVEITGAASEDIAPTVTTNAINTTTAGAAGTRVTMSALVKDANGAILPAGIAVTWSISGLPGTSAIWTDPTTGYNWATSYTNSSGVAVTHVYAWATGTVSVSATAGGKAAATAGKINFINAPGDARVVTATVVGNVITAKVVDRYGNVVKGVNLSATRTAGTGYFAGSASSGATGITGANGTVDFIVTGGDVTVTVATTTLNDGQTSSAAGQVNGTAVTATGIGASLAPVGVQSVSVAVTGFVSQTDAKLAALQAALEALAAKSIADKAASDAAIAKAEASAVAAAEAAADAAAEAIDAGNNAFDAATSAGEAADAATAAAEQAGEDATAAATAAGEAAVAAAEAAQEAAAEATDAANAATDAAKEADHISN
jgi:hypothetical protein